MRDDLTTSLYISAHLSGVAPKRHELTRQQHVEKLMARHEAEQRAATIGRAMRAMAQFWSLLRAAFAPAHSIGIPEPGRRSLPAE